MKKHGRVAGRRRIHINSNARAAVEAHLELVVVGSLSAHVALPQQIPLHHFF